MTIQESIKDVQERRRALDVEILRAIRVFQSETGLCVDSIDLVHIRTMGRTPEAEVVDVRVVVNI